MTTREEHVEALGQAADTADNLLEGLKLPVPWEVHRQGLEHSLKELRDELREAYIGLGGDADTWEHGYRKKGTNARDQG